MQYFLDQAAVANEEMVSPGDGEEDGGTESKPDSDKTEEGCGKLS